MNAPCGRIQNAIRDLAQFLPEIDVHERTRYIHEAFTVMLMADNIHNTQELNYYSYIPTGLTPNDPLEILDESIIKPELLDLDTPPDISFVGCESSPDLLSPPTFQDNPEKECSADETTDVTMPYLRIPSTDLDSILSDSDDEDLLDKTIILVDECYPIVHEIFQVKESLKSPIMLKQRRSDLLICRQAPEVVLSDKRVRTKPARFQPISKEKKKRKVLTNVLNCVRTNPVRYQSEFHEKKSKVLTKKHVKCMHKSDPMETKPNILTRKYAKGQLDHQVTEPIVLAKTRVKRTYKLKLLDEFPNILATKRVSTKPVRYQAEPIRKDKLKNSSTMAEPKSKC